MITSNEGTYDYIRAMVSEDGISLRYQCTGLGVAGRDVIDDDATNWTDHEIRKVVASYLNVTYGVSEIEVSFD